MASLIPGYEYDIFISYRQKDNKYDGWVSEFADNLKRELEATFKEEISVYFDMNPHDGLLETHDVDESLKEKLRCLIFIPVISHTYCDPKSFAWEHEFKAFIAEAAKDQFGLKIKLPNGNVANRVLPVRIHDLDAEDIKLCESNLGSTLRGVEFIYKSPGVNRPLRFREDKLHDNINKTIYRDQINKVANAVKEIFSGIRTGEELSEKEQTLRPMPWGEINKERIPDVQERFTASIPVDRQLLRMIENEYPYPVALEFRRLNTKEYLAIDESRLRQILKLSETAIHLVSLISVVDLLENCRNPAFSITADFKKQFPVLFTRTSYGKWITLTRECINLFNTAGKPMFIPEIRDLFFDEDGGESKSLRAFNKITTIRNRLSHPEFSLTSKIIEEFCVETEANLMTILKGLEFLTRYSFLYVDHILVKYRKWNNPTFFHTFSEMTGNSSEFNAYNKILSEIVNTPALIIVKGGEEKNYLNLDPVMIYSNEGENKIADIFMYTDWDKDKTVRYKPVWNGGQFGLSGTTIEVETVSSLLKFFEFFSEGETYQGYKTFAEKLIVTI
jgi:hypothetical protein